MRKNENSGFYLINYAKIRVKMTYFIASLPEARFKAINQKYFCLKAFYLGTPDSPLQNKKFGDHQWKNVTNLHKSNL